MKAYAFRRGGSSFVSSSDDLPAKLGARTNRARSLHQSVLLEMLELAKGAGDVVRNKALDCVGIRAPGHRAAGAVASTVHEEEAQEEMSGPRLSLGVGLIG